MKSKLEELIEKLCPNGVEYKELNKILDYEQPTKYIVKHTNYNDNYEIPVLTAGQSFILGYTNETTGIYGASKENPVIIFDDFTTSFHWVDFNFKIKSSAMKFLKLKKENEVVFRYIFHCMRNINYKPVDHSRQWIEKYSKIEIPLPPLEIQEEIVRILDKFTELTAELTTELTTELTLRKQQYEHYRDELLTFRDEVKKENLGILAEIKTGVKPEIILENNGKYEYINAGTANSGYTNNYNCEKDVVTTPSRGQGGIGFIGYQKNNFWLGPLCYKIKSYNSERVLNKYLYYYISKNRLDIFKIKNEGGVPAINKKDLEKITIKFPPLEEQKRIVEILDRFDKYINDIKEGLSAEIEMRQKQYEYYRDNLLDFKKLNVEG